MRSTLSLTRGASFRSLLVIFVVGAVVVVIVFATAPPLPAPAVWRGGGWEWLPLIFILKLLSIIKNCYYGCWSNLAWLRVKKGKCFSIISFLDFSGGKKERENRKWKLIMGLKVRHTGSTRMQVKASEERKKRREGARSSRQHANHTTMQPTRKYQYDIIIVINK